MKEEIAFHKDDGHMACFMVEAVRISNTELKLQVRMHDDMIVAETGPLPLIEQAYSALFDFCKNGINKLRDAHKPAPLALSAEDWAEIYKALQYQRDAFFTAGFPAKHENKLNSLLALIGPDGSDAAERGVKAV